MKPETNLLRELPSVDRVMTHPAAAPLLERFSRPFVTETLRDLIDELRQVIKSGHDLPPHRLQDESIITDLEKKLAQASRPGMVRVVNASGTILHTNLGRALLSEVAPITSAVSTPPFTVRLSRHCRLDNLEAAVPDLAFAGDELAGADRGDGVVRQIPPRYADSSPDETVDRECKVEVVEAVLLAVAGEVVHVNQVQVEEECRFSVLRGAPLFLVVLSRNRPSALFRS